jgi:hypothetical protein
VFPLRCTKVFFWIGDARLDNCLRLLSHKTGVHCQIWPAGRALCVSQRARHVWHKKHCSDNFWCAPFFVFFGLAVRCELIANVFAFCVCAHNSRISVGCTVCDFLFVQNHFCHPNSVSKVYDVQCFALHPPPPQLLLSRPSLV